MATPESFTDELLNAITDTEIECECPNCGKDITFTISDVGTSIKCPHCGEDVDLEAE